VPRCRNPVTVDGAPAGAPSGGYPRPAIEFIGAFESTYQPAFDVDVAETTGHVARWQTDLELLVATGVRRVRYPVRWHRIEQERGRFDWRETDRVLGWMQDHGLRPIAALLHHTSYPRWLKRGFADRRFGSSYLRYLEAFAGRYPWIGDYTLFNEPFTTLFLCEHEGVWAPRLRVHLEQCEIAQGRGVPVEGYCWFPFVDSCDWDSVLVRSEGHIDPVGVYWLDERLDRRPSSMSASFAMAARGAPAADLPAYRFRPPVSRWLAGWMDQMSHWDWQDPPHLEVGLPPPGTSGSPDVTA